MTLLRAGLLVLLLLVCSVSLPFTVRCQTTPTTQTPPVGAAQDSVSFFGFSDATAGPVFSAGASRMIDNIPDGWHSDPRFAYNFGLYGELCLNSWLAVDLGLSYDARELYLGSSGDSTNVDINVSSLSVQPSIRIYWLLLGLSFDLPTSGSATETITSFDHLGVPTHLYQANRDIAGTDLNSVTELRAAISIPVFHAESGIIRFFVTGSYPLGNPVAGTTSFDSTDGHFANVGKGIVPTVQAGLTYQFDLLH